MARLRHIGFESRGSVRSEFLLPKTALLQCANCHLPRLTLR